MSREGWPPVLSASELVAFFVAPDAAEQLSPIDGPGGVVLDLSDASLNAKHLSACPPETIAGLTRLIPTLPCVSVAMLSQRVETPRSSVGLIAQELASCCDVRVADEIELGELLRGFADTPLAALVFVQLLRNDPRASIYQGLVAESFAYSTLQTGTEFASWMASRRSGRGPFRRKSAKSDKSRRNESLTSGPACRIERDRERLDIWLSRPSKHNAFSQDMRDSLSEALQWVLCDPSIKEIVLRGEGESFCSGGDLDEFGSSPDPLQAHAIRMTRSPAHLMSRLADRVRCELHGACIGAGAELPAFTGRVVADENAFFALPEVALGLVPGAGGTVSLPRRIGRQRTAWLGLSGQRIDAQTALEWGLVDEVRLGTHAESQTAIPPKNNES